MKDKNQYIQLLGSLSKACLCIAFLTSPVHIMAQEEEEIETVTDTIVRPVRATKPEPVYEMKDVQGYVYDAATKKPVEGARVQAYGNSRYSALTDENGHYSLKVPVFVTSLYVSTPEYNDLQAAIYDSDMRDMALYSDKFRKHYTPTLSPLSQPEAIVDMSSAISVDAEIENQLGGDVHTINRSGLQGQGAAMFIHGLNSLNLNAQPLIVLDGIIMDMQLDRSSIHEGFFNNILSGIDPEDIQSVKVLKNGTALYGSRGGNGVIIINTKRGQSMATKINVSVFGGFELKPATMSMMNASQYKRYVSDLIGTTEYGMLNSTASTSIPFLNDNKDYYWYPMYHNETNWSDGLYRNAFTQNYKVNVQGGDEVAMYNLSLGYANSQSTMKDNGFDRLNIRFNTDIKLFDKVSSQFDVAFSRLTNHLRDNGWAENYEGSTIASPNVLGLIQAPFLSKYAYYTGNDGKLHQSGVYAGQDYTDANYPFGFASRFATNAALANPYWIISNGKGDNKNFQEVAQFILNVTPKWQINKNLIVSNRFSYMLNRTTEKYYLPIAGTPLYNLTDMGDVNNAKKSLAGKETSILEDLRIDWNNKYGAHAIEVFGGMRFTSNSYDNSTIRGYGGSNDKLPDHSSTDKFKQINGEEDQWKNLAYYAHAAYSYKDTYFADAIFTAETSSRFGKEASEGMKLFGVRWGLFPSLQAGWLITNEPWMKGARGINQLKLTAGYEESGNDNIGYSLSQTYFKAVPFIKTAIGLQLNNVENPSIQWETTRKWNIGLSGSFLNNRVQAGAEVYFSNTDNLLTMTSMTNYLSGLDAYWTNGGKLRNTGVDAFANIILVNTKNFKWQIGASMGHYNNEIKSLPADYLSTNIYGAEIRTIKGHAAGVFYGYKTEGVFASDADARTASKTSSDGYLKYPTGIEKMPYKNFQAGDVHFTDIYDDGVIDSKDMTIIGDPNPDIFGNIYTNFSYKKWSLDINFKYSVGNDIYNYNRSQLENGNSFYNQTKAVANRWTHENQVTTIPRVMTTNSEQWVNNERFSDRWIEDGSYIKLKKVRLSYTLPLNKSWIQGLTIWAETNNLFSIDKYTGKDPEFAVGNGVLYQGIDAGMLPSNRSFNMGVKINL
mgnify:CR=1 FL=1